MADSKISALTAASDLTGADIPIVQGGANKRAGIALFTPAAIGAATAAQGAKADLAVLSDTTGITGADAVTNIVSLTQAEYNAIGSPSASTLYIITDA